MAWLIASSVRLAAAAAFVTTSTVASPSGAALFSPEIGALRAALRAWRTAQHQTERRRLGKNSVTSTNSAPSTYSQRSGYAAVR